MDNAMLEAVKTGDLAMVEDRLRSGVDVNEGDEHGWTPLSFAAGRGDLSMVKLLVENGADVFQVGRDKRTPSMIALAAGRTGVVTYLHEIEGKLAPEKTKSLKRERKFCKAYYIRDLRKFPGWPTESFPDDKVIFIHRDFTVTESIHHGEEVVLSQVDEPWRQFCSTTLGFKVPTDLDLTVAKPE